MSARYHSSRPPVSVFHPAVVHEQVTCHGIPYDCGNYSKLDRHAIQPEMLPLYILPGKSHLPARLLHRHRCK